MPYQRLNSALTAATQQALKDAKDAARLEPRSSEIASLVQNLESEEALLRPLAHASNSTSSAQPHTDAPGRLLPLDLACASYVLK